MNHSLRCLGNWSKRFCTFTVLNNETHMKNQHWKKQKQHNYTSTTRNLQHCKIKLFYLLRTEHIYLTFFTHYIIKIVYSINNNCNIFCGKLKQYFWLYLIGNKNFINKRTKVSIDIHLLDKDMIHLVRNW